MLTIKTSEENSEIENNDQSDENCQSEDSTEQYYNVEEILDVIVINGEEKYLVKWEGYPHSQNTWEPLASFGSNLHLINQFIEKRNRQNHNCHFMDDSFDRKNGRKRLGSRKKTSKKRINKGATVFKKKPSTLKKSNPSVRKDNSSCRKSLPSVKKEKCSSNKRKLKKIDPPVKQKRNKIYEEEKERNNRRKTLHSKSPFKSMPLRKNFDIAKNPKPLRKSLSGLRKSKTRKLSNQAPKVRKASKDSLVASKIPKWPTNPAQASKPMLIKESQSSQDDEDTIRLNIKKRDPKESRKPVQKILPVKSQPSTAVPDTTEGSLQTDIPLKIERMKVINNEFCAYVIWKERPDGIIPDKSFCTVQEMKKNNIELVCDFYESKIKMKKDTKSN
ncbi:unnamed protein product [Moneuplotes crassus]|uniref:Chromo domain-containing protein n=1 Tax=Euplotes crassus TaxID=5936 RepID=A0AAD1UQU3_EUPCR|nr:unnamed protein product [Moneuplotes crassus]